MKWGTSHRQKTDNSTEAATVYQKSDIAVAVF